MSRASATKLALEQVDILDPSKQTSKHLKSLLDALSDKDFEAMIVSMENGEYFLPYFMPNLSDKTPRWEQIKKAADTLKVPLFTKVWIYDEQTKTKMLSRYPLMCLHLPVRRQIQMLVSKISLPEDTKHINDLTDQPTGVSANASISAPEASILVGIDAVTSASELLAVRGGDPEALRAMEQSIHDTGGVGMSTVEAVAVGATSTRTLSTMLSGMHYDTNLDRA